MSPTSLGQLRAHAPLLSSTTRPTCRLRCSATPLRAPLSTFLVSEPTAVPAFWPQDTDHLVEGRTEAGLHTWSVAIYFGNDCPDWRDDFALLEQDGLCRTLSAGIDSTRLTPTSSVLLIHRFALNGRPALVAVVPIQSLHDLS